MMSASAWSKSTVRACALWLRRPLVTERPGCRLGVEGPEEVEELGGDGGRQGGAYALAAGASLGPTGAVQPQKGFPFFDSIFSAWLAV